MKKLSVFAAALAILVGAQASALTTVSSEQLQGAMLSQLSPIHVADLINWKVGDTANYDVAIAGMKLGTSVKTIDREEGHAIWMIQNMNLMGQAQKIEALISREDGKILKLIVNGKEQAPPANDLEIISQDYTEITVPAGTFKAIHIVAKTKDVSKLEVWANPQDVVMDGSIKESTTMQFGEMVMTLTSQKRGN